MFQYLQKEIAHLQIKKSNLSLGFVETRNKGGSPFSKCESWDCKIRSLRMRFIIRCTRPHVFTSFARLFKFSIFKTAENQRLFSYLGSKVKCLQLAYLWKENFLRINIVLRCRIQKMGILELS